MGRSKRTELMGGVVPTQGRVRRSSPLESPAAGMRQGHVSRWATGLKTSPNQGCFLVVTLHQAAPPMPHATRPVTGAGCWLGAQRSGSGAEWGLGPAGGTSGAPPREEPIRWGVGWGSSCAARTRQLR